MKLSHYEQCELSAIDRVLSHDATLRAVADLFAVPPPSSSGRTVREPRPSKRAIAGRPTHPVVPRFKSTVLIALVAAAGLVCAVVTAPLNRAVMSQAGLVLAVCAGVLFVVVVARRDSMVDRSHLAPEQRRSTSVGRRRDA